MGRLDKPSTGLLLLTSDGKWADKIIHPRKKIPKVYIVRAKGKINRGDLHKLRKGIQLQDGKTEPAKVFMKNYNKSQDISKIRMTLYEGKKRQIRRMIKEISGSVISLKRVKIASIRLGNLPEGSGGI